MKNISFLSEIFQFLGVKFSTYLNRLVFVMLRKFSLVQLYYIGENAMLQSLLTAGIAHLIIPRSDQKPKKNAVEISNLATPNKGSMSALDLGFKCNETKSPAKTKFRIYIT